MQRVFTNSMVAHVWAQQSQDSGRNGKGSIYFEGPTIYSYRSSWPMASFVTNKRGERAVLFRMDTYSPTTGQHMGLARRATNQYQRFDVARGYDGTLTAKAHEDNKADFKARVQARAEKAMRARVHADWDIERTRELADEANKYAEFFGLRWRVAMPEFSDEFRAQVKARTAAQAAKSRKENKARNEKARRELAVAVHEWRNGYADSLPFRHPATLLRIRGDEVQTSKGARVPVDHAKRLWPIIKRVMASGTAYQRNGHTEHIGQFAVDRIEPNGDMTAGCHFIKHAELAAIAVALGI